MITKVIYTYWGGVVQTEVSSCRQKLLVQILPEYILPLCSWVKHLTHKLLTTIKSVATVSMENKKMFVITTFFF